MIEALEQIDQDLFFFLNSLHSDFLDPVMYQVSKTLTWLPVYLFVLFLMIRTYRWQTILWLLMIALAVTMSDQLTSGFMKPFFERYRPSRDPNFEEGLVHIVNDYKGGMYGFVSSHAANAFAVATLLYLTLRGHYSQIWLIFLVAGLIAYSRIYLGVHYPSDVLLGGLIGFFFGWICFKAGLWAMNRWWPLHPGRS